jgi:hypothetical protein
MSLPTIELAKLCAKDQDKIKFLPITLLFRYSLKLVRTYPSIKKEEMREELILEYHEKKNLKDSEEIQNAIFSARAFLSHLITYNLLVRELNREDTNRVHSNVTTDLNNVGIQQNKKKSNDNIKKFDYFNL